MAPYLLAAFFGLLISATLHFVLIWPAQEPRDDSDEGDHADATDAPAPADLDHPAGERAPGPA